LAYSFVRHVFVHDDTPVDFGGKRPEGIQVHQIPHGPYEVAEPKIGGLEMRRRLGFLTTKDTNLHERGEEVLTTDCTDEHGYFQGAQGHAQGTCAGASESDSLTSELADAPVSESPTLSASGPASALCADDAEIVSAGGNQLADSKEVLEEQSQAGLQMDSQKLQSIRAANDTSASKGNSSSVPIREIRGSNSEALDAGRSTLDVSAPADVVFLAFGQIRDGKNLDLFLQAMTRLPENVKLLVAGKGDSGSSRPAEYYQKLAQELGVAKRCRWDIRRIPDDEVGDFFAACDVVLVTYSANFRSASGVLNAAVSARKPVLASSGLGPLKTVVEKYHLGFFVEPDNPEEFLRGSKQLMDALAAPAFSCHSVDTPTPLEPEWERYERENSWEVNAKVIVQNLG
jgi:glycosyltransferase involved in cell wall biosynthesis